MRFSFFFTLPAVLLFCQHHSESLGPVNTPTSKQIEILALGDSYTKGERVPWKDNFPHQLADSLRASGQTVADPKIIAETGWRTDDLQDAIAAQSRETGGKVFDLVTLCIGVNNQYQQADFDSYLFQFEDLLKTALARAGGRKDRVIVLSIPDWAFTPYGQAYERDPSVISKKIDDYNHANQTIAATYGVHYVNITGISRRGLSVPALVARDGLHPSAAQYSEWVSTLLPVVRTALEN